ncbi:MAG: hypothetical protein ACRDI3_08475 [Actinomycetota bacterium]
MSVARPAGVTLVVISLSVLGALPAWAQSRPLAPPPPPITQTNPEPSSTPSPTPSHSVRPDSPVATPSTSPIAKVIGGTLEREGTKASAESLFPSVLALSGAQIALFTLLGLASIMLGTVLTKLSRRKKFSRT